MLGDRCVRGPKSCEVHGAEVAKYPHTRGAIAHTAHGKSRFRDLFLLKLYGGRTGEMATGTA